MYKGKYGELIDRVRP